MKRLIMYFAFFAIAFHSQAQVNGEAEYLIRYEVDFILDSTNRADIKNEVHRLYTGSSVSYYASEASVLRDSLFQAKGRNARLDIIASGPKSSFIPKVYKDFNKMMFG